MALKSVMINFLHTGLDSMMHKTKEAAVAIGVIKSDTKEMSLVQNKLGDLTVRQADTLKKVLNSHKLTYNQILEEKAKALNMLTIQKEQQNRIKDYLLMQKKGTLEYSNATDLLGQQNKMVAGMTASYGIIADRASAIQDPFREMLSAGPLRMIGMMVDKMSKFNDAAMAIQEAGGMTKMLEGFFLNANKAAGIFSSNLAKAFGPSLMSALLNFGSGLAIIGKQLLALSIKLLPYTMAIMAAIALAYLFKKVWEFNIGGIQTKWFQFIGRIQDIWGKFQQVLYKTLDALRPMFEGAFGLLYNLLSPIIESIGAVVDMFNLLPDSAKGVALAIGGIAIAMILLNTSTGGILLAVGLTLALMAKFPIVGKIVAGIILAIAAAWVILNVASAGILPLIGLIATGLILLGAWINKLVQGMGGWGKLMEAIATPFKNMWDWIIKMVKAIGGWKAVLMIVLGPIGIMIFAITKIVTLFGGWKKVLGGVWQMFLLLLNPIKLLKILLSTIKFPPWLQKIVDGFLGKGAKEIAGGKAAKEIAGGKAGEIMKSSADKAAEQEKSKRELKRTALSPQTSSQTIWNKQKSSTINNNSNVTIHSSGAIDSKQAPRIADIMVSTLHSKGQMG